MIARKAFLKYFIILLFLVFVTVPVSIVNAEANTQDAKIITEADSPSEESVLITLDSNGGSFQTAKKYEFSVSKNVHVDLDEMGLQEPFREGYVFDSWNTKPDGTGFTPKQYDYFSKDITFYAIWRKKITITFIANGGYFKSNKIDPETNDYKKTNSNSSTDIEESPGEGVIFYRKTKDLFHSNKKLVFKEWNTKADGKGTKYKNFRRVYKNVTLYAIWIDPPKQKVGEDGTPLGKGTYIKYAEQAITKMSSEKDPPGSTCEPLYLWARRVWDNKIRLCWNRIENDEGERLSCRYLVYGNVCGKKMRKIAETKSPSVYVTKIKKKLAPGKYYKFMVVAVDKNNLVVATSTMIHAATSGGKVGNPTIMGGGTKAKKLKIGESLKLNLKAVSPNKKLKVKKHVGLRYVSSDPKIATVSKKGVIKAKQKGRCYVCVYAQNGSSRQIQVVVK